MAKPPDLREVEAAFLGVLQALGIEPGPHTEGTPWRCAKAWVNEIVSGLYDEPPKITSFHDPSATGLIVCGQIPIKSVCAHHLLPFVGEAVIGYIPGESQHIVGLSKLSRIANYFSRRPQVQEQLTHDIAEFLMERLGPGAGVGVLIRARHMCMELRGVNHVGEMTTSELRGCLKVEADARAEFLELARQK